MAAVEDSNLRSFATVYRPGSYPAATSEKRRMPPTRCRTFAEESLKHRGRRSRRQKHWRDFDVLLTPVES